MKYNKKGVGYGFIIAIIALVVGVILVILSLVLTYSTLMSNFGAY